MEKYGWSKAKQNNNVLPVAYCKSEKCIYKEIWIKTKSYEYSVSFLIDIWGFSIWCYLSKWLTELRILNLFF